MQVFFAVSCLLAVLALSNGASGQSRAGSEAQAAIIPTIEVRQVAETAVQTGAVERQTKEEVTSDGVAVELRSTTQELETAAPESKDATEVTDEATRGKGHLIRVLLRQNACQQSGCVIPGCAWSCGQTVSPCLQAGGCGTNTIVVHEDVPVPHPVPIHVPIIKVVHQNVPVAQPVAVPVVKVVHVPVPVIAQPAVQPCCEGRVTLLCTSPCLD